MKLTLSFVCLLLTFVSLPSPAAPDSASCEKPQIRATVNRAAKAWIDQDWKTMYGFLSRSEQEHLPYDQFVLKRSQISKIEKLIALQVTNVVCMSRTRSIVHVSYTFTKSPDSRVIWGGGSWYSAHETGIWYLIRERGDWKVKLKPPPKSSH